MREKGEKHAKKKKIRSGGEVPHFVQKSLVGVDEMKPTPPQTPPRASSESESSVSSAQEGEEG